MEDLTKYAEISGYKGKYLEEVLETLKNKGFQIVKEDATDTEDDTWIIYGIVK